MFETVFYLVIPKFQLDKLKFKGHTISMKPRTISKLIHKVIKTFPAIVLTGPRQSGKTTLLKHEFPNYQYASLEDPDVRIRAKDDPNGFLNQFEKQVILDEIQYVPELLSYIKSKIDENRMPGKWILSGSQNFSLMKNVSQSLAGRAAILTLLPFSVAERIGNGNGSLLVDKVLSLSSESNLKSKFDLNEIILRGNYPEVASNTKVDRQIWDGSYINTYLERDIRNLKQVGDLGQFEIFLRACAIRTGQILDLSSISREIGITFTTAKRWLSLLETGYQIFLLHPYYRNIGKRLVKRPKIYFADTGLATYLMGINSVNSLVSSYLYGAIFETLIVTDFWKRYFHHGQIPQMYFLRTHDDLEVDLLIENQNKLNLIEVKLTSTVRKENIQSLIKARTDIRGVDKTLVISNTKEKFSVVEGITNIPAESVLTV